MSSRRYIVRDKVSGGLININGVRGFDGIHDAGILG